MAKTHLLNIDLDIESKSPLIKLVESFDEEIIVLHHQRLEETDYLSVELSSACGNYHSLNELLDGLCDVIEALPADARAEWDKCNKRIFDIGFEAGNDHQRHYAEISSDRVRRIGHLKGSILVTIYPCLESG